MPCVLLLVWEGVCVSSMSENEPLPFCVVLSGLMFQFTVTCIKKKEVLVGEWREGQIWNKKDSKILMVESR